MDNKKKVKLDESTERTIKNWSIKYISTRIPVKICVVGLNEIDNTPRETASVAKRIEDYQFLTGGGATYSLKKETFDEDACKKAGIPSIVVESFREGT